MSIKQELFKIDNVYINETMPETSDGIKFFGNLYLWQQDEGKFIEWVTSENESHYLSQSNLKTTKFNDKLIIKFDIDDLKSIRKHTPILLPSYLTFILKCGTTCPALYFQDGGTSLVISKLQKYIHLNRSAQDSSLYVVRNNIAKDFKTGKSFSEFNLFESENGGDVLSNFIQDPYTSTLGGFSRITKFLHDNFVHNVDPFTDFSIQYQSSKKDSHENNNIAILDNTNELTINTDESGFAFITSANREQDLPARCIIVRECCMTAKQWSSSMDHEGRLTDVASVKMAIFKGGIDPSIRQEVWKFLLGYYKWDSTYKSRVEDRKQKIDDYFRMKLQWKSFSEEQLSKFAALRDRKSLAEKDVLRTDRKHKFFEGPHNQNIKILYDILLTHCMHDFDLGYVQGMSDLLAPILVVMEHEVDAFWCFAGFIKLLGCNFEKDQQAMKNQLLQLQILLTYVDPQLSNYLESHDSLNMYFCFRWLLIVFKREFNFPDIMKLWEVLWTGLPCKNFHLLICLSILDSAKSTLIENNFGFPEILKYINDLSGNINVNEVLQTAEAMFIQLRDSKYLSETIRKILGLHISDENSEHSPSPFQPFHPFEVSSKVTASSKHNSAYNLLDMNNHKTNQNVTHKSEIQTCISKEVSPSSVGSIINTYDHVDEIKIPDYEKSVKQFDLSEDCNIELVESCDSDNSNHHPHSTSSNNI